MDNGAPLNQLKASSLEDSDSFQGGTMRIKDEEADDTNGAFLNESRLSSLFTHDERDDENDDEEEEEVKSGGMLIKSSLC